MRTIAVRCHRRWAALGSVALMGALMGALACALACARGANAVNPAAPMWLNRPAWAMRLSFRRPLIAEQGLTARTGIEKGVPGIDVRHGRVFVGTSDHALYALHAADGSTLWRFQTAGSVQSEPLYDLDRDVVFFGSDDDGMYAVRARDGSMIWRYRTGAEVQRRPVLAKSADGKSTLVFVNAADSVFAVDPDNGHQRWKRLRTPALGLEIAGHAGVTVAGDRVYTAFSTGKVAAYDVMTGADRWSDVDLSTTGSVATDDQQKYFDVDTTPVVYGDRVYVASVANGVFALDATSGGPVWRRQQAEGVSWLALWSEPKHVDAATQAEVAERVLLIAGSGTTGLWALDPKSGEVRWRKEVPRGAVSFPVEISGALMVTTSKVGLFLIDPRLGHVIDGIDPGSGFAGGAAAYGTRAFVLTNAGVLLGLQVIAPRAAPPTTRAWP